MYLIEVKRHLVATLFPPAEGWRVWVDLDAMELGKGVQNRDEKRTVAAECERWLRGAGVEIGAHPRYGRVDVVATRGDVTHIVEVEGASSRQLEQAVYSALGQLLLVMGASGPSFALAVPDLPEWDASSSRCPLAFGSYLISTFCLCPKRASGASLRARPNTRLHLTARRSDVCEVEWPVGGRSGGKCAARPPVGSW